MWFHGCNSRAVYLWMIHVRGVCRACAIQFGQFGLFHPVVRAFEPLGPSRSRTAEVWSLVPCCQDGLGFVWRKWNSRLIYSHLLLFPSISFVLRRFSASNEWCHSNGTKSDHPKSHSHRSRAARRDCPRRWCRLRRRWRGGIDFRSATPEHYSGAPPPRGRCVTRPPFCRPLWTTDQIQYPTTQRFFSLSGVLFLTAATELLKPYLKYGSTRYVCNRLLWEFA